MVSVVIPRGEELSEARKKQLIEDLENHPIRKLTNEERDLYGRAIIKAVLLVPAFRDIIALIRPYMDATAPTAYTDPYSRVGLGYWFFYILDEVQRASVILHECMHVLNNHFQRREEIKTLKASPQLFNLAGDFEINTVLHKVRMVDLSEGQLPDRAPNNYPPYKTMEQYAVMLAKEEKEAEDNCEACQQEKKDKQAKKDASNSPEKQDNDSPDDSGQNESDDSQGSGDSDANDSGDDENNGSDGDSGANSEAGEGNEPGGQDGKPSHTCGKEDGDGDGQGQGSGQPGEGKGKPGKDDWNCGSSSEETEAAADEAGVERASDVEATIAKQNTAARIVEERNNAGRGTSVGNEFWDSILKHLTPPVVDWRKILRRVVASSVDSIIKGRSDYTYRRVSRRLQDRHFIFPGMLDYQPKIMVGIDTSGSMGNEDYQKALTEIESMLKEVARGKDSVRIFSVDTKVGKITPVSSVKKIRLEGGGGTVMAVAWKYVKSLARKDQPDIFILVTDGGIDWADVETEVRSSKFKSVICVTQKYGFDAAPHTLKRHSPVIDISKTD